MNKRRRLLSLLMAMALIIVSLAACSSKGNDKQGETDKGETPATGTEVEDVIEEEVEIEVIRVWSDNAHEKALRDKQIEGFNNGIGKELGIEIEYTVYGSNFSDTIKIAAQAGEAPDLYRADSQNGYLTL